MLDIVNQIVDRLVSLVKMAQEKQRLLFEEHVEPVFLDMTQIHQDYVGTIRQVKQSIESGMEIEDVQNKLEDKREELNYLRTKVQNMSVVLYEEKTKEQYLQAFVKACINYFNIGSDMSTCYRTLLTSLDKLSTINANSDDQSRRQACLDSVDRILDTINKLWSEVTFTYAQAKANYLS